MALRITRTFDVIRDILGEDTETMIVGRTLFVDRLITIEEKRVIKRRFEPDRMKNVTERGEARIEL